MFLVYLMFCYWANVVSKIVDSLIFSCVCVGNNSKCLDLHKLRNERSRVTGHVSQFDIFSRLTTLYYPFGLPIKIIRCWLKCLLPLRPGPYLTVLKIVTLHQLQYNLFSFKTNIQWTRFFLCFVNNEPTNRSSTVLDCEWSRVIPNDPNNNVCSVVTLFP